MHICVSLCNDWHYSPDFDESYLDCGYDDSAWQVVDLPHANTLLDRHYFNEKQFCFVSCYRKKLQMDLQEGMTSFIRFEGVSSKAEIYIDGVLYGSHHGAYLPFDVNLGEKHKVVVTVVVDSREDEQTPPFGGSMDYLSYGGIYRTVTLHRVHSMRLLSLFVESLASDMVAIRGESKHAQGASYKAIIYDDAFEVARYEGIMLNEHFDFSLNDMHLVSWSPEHPKLYRLEFFLEEYDHKRVFFGSRSARFERDGFFLNGEKRKLIGLNRHQSYPYVGYAMSKSGQREDAVRLKELGVDLVRTSHYPQDPAFLDACDELGLLVFEEIPGWQHISSLKQWRDRCLQNVQDMIERDFNHPSIILWGVRINESQDDDELYAQTNNLARTLDPHRATGGVRNFQHSHLLEDVYTYNDFSHTGQNPGLDKKKSICNETSPYLVTEFCGHMYPTKRSDPPSLRAEHALRHYRVLDAMFGQEGVSGAIGWCMNDYNTHSNFGSGDQVCYHGVCDQFRNPKLAGYVYMSQKDEPKVLVVSSQMDNGDYTKAFFDHMFICTNCEAVRIFHNEEEVGTYYPSHDVFPHLPHPPILLNDLIGKRLDKESYLSAGDRNKMRKLLKKVGNQGGILTVSDKLAMLRFMKKYRLKREDAVNLYSEYVGNWGSHGTIWKFEGLSGGKVITSETYGESRKPYLSATCRSSLITLQESYEVIQIHVEIRKEGMTLPLPYAHEAFCVELHGPLALLSPALTQCEGGTGVVYLRTVGEKGEAEVTIHSNLGDKTLAFTIG